MNTDLLTYCRNMKMSYSYKPVLILALLDHQGHVTLDEAAEYFRRFYNRRLGLGLVAERSDSIFSTMNCRFEDIRQNIRSNPVSALLNSSNLFSFDGETLSLKNLLTPSERDAVKDACNERLTKYYDALKAPDIICFSRPDDAFGFMSNDFPSMFTLHDRAFQTVTEYIRFRKNVMAQSTVPLRLKGEMWNGQRQLVAYQAIMAKFTQNRGIKDDLLDTGHAIIGACLDLDTVWGNGLTIDDCNADNISQWRGHNLLGYTLMWARSALRCG